MKEKRLKRRRNLLIVIFFTISLVPWINNYLQDHITYEIYFFILMCLVMSIFMITIHLYFVNKTKGAFAAMEADVDFYRYQKESIYKENKDFYYRDLPFNKDMFRLFWIGFQYGIIKDRGNILNAFLLKWCKEGRITFISKGKYEINNKQISFENHNEELIFNMLQSSCKKQFIKLTIFNSNMIFKKINDILLSQTSEFRKEGKIKNINGEDVIMDTIKEEVDIVYGFKNFLLNIGLISQKYPKEVMLWEEYLIYAELLGIAKQVKKEFKRLDIDFSSKEAKFKKINKGIINFIKRMLNVSYILYGAIFLIATYFIWMLYAWFTWNII